MRFLQVYDAVFEYDPDQLQPSIRASGKKSTPTLAWIRPSGMLYKQVFPPVCLVENYSCHVAFVERGGIQRHEVSKATRVHL